MRTDRPFRRAAPEAAARNARTKARGDATASAEAGPSMSLTMSPTESTTEKATENVMEHNGRNAVDAVDAVDTAAEDIVAELARLLPTPPKDALSAERYDHHKEALLRHIDQDVAVQGTTVGEFVRTDAPRPAAGRQPARPRRYVRVLVPAGSVGLAAALAATLLSGPHHFATRPGAGAQAVVTLQRIADASLRTDAVPVGDDQYVYVRRLLRENNGAFGGPVRMSALHTWEQWAPQTPAPLTTLAWQRESGKDAVMPGEMVPVEASGPGTAPGLDRPTYRWFASLPTNPQALRRVLYAQVRPAEGESKDQAVFRTVGDLLGDTLMPPATEAALYRAVAGIPGVRQIPDAVDAAGRHGLAITREDPHDATRDEWIFDRHSLAFLGSRSYVAGPAAGKEGARPTVLYGTDAVMQRAVVDRRGQEPARPAGTADTAGTAKG